MVVVQALLYVLSVVVLWPSGHSRKATVAQRVTRPTVYDYCRKCRHDGSWKRLHDHLMQWVRVDAGRGPSPSAGSLDAQSVPTAVMVHQTVGYDAGKKTKGRKRFTLVDTFGLLLEVKVVAASTPEREGAKQWLQQGHQERHRLPRLVRLWVDGGFSGEDFLHWIMDTFCLILETVLRPQATTGFILLPKRWMVKRTYGWLHWCHRLNVGYERLPESSEAFIYIAMIQLMLRRLA